MSELVLDLPSFRGKLVEIMNITVSIEGGNVIRLLSPPVIEDNDLHRGLDIIEESLGELITTAKGGVS